MPELPEVEQAARTLGEQIVGAHFDGTIRCSWLKTIEGHAPDLLGAQLRDVQVTGWRRRAKWILITLDNQIIRGGVLLLLQHIQETEHEHSLTVYPHFQRAIEMLNYEL